MSRSGSSQPRSKPSQRDVVSLAFRSLPPPNLYLVLVPKAGVYLRFTPFAHFLLGGAHVSVRGDTDNSFATAVGGGLDYRLIHGLAWRLQLDNLHTNFFSIGENRLRYATGVNLRF